MLFDGACPLAPTRPPTAMVKPPRWKLQLLRAADGIDTVRSWPQGQLHWLQQLLIDVHADATLQARTKSWETDAVLRALCDQDVLSLLPPRARHKLAGVHSSMHAAIATLPDPWLAHQRSTGRLRTCPQCKLQLWTDDFAWPGSDKPRSICNMCKDKLMDAHNCKDWATLRQAL
jgi:hypothetical protein